MWNTWIETQVYKIENATGKKIAPKIFDAIGYRIESRTVTENGLLAYSTIHLIKEKIKQILCEERINQAQMLIEKNWKNCEFQPEEIKPLANLPELFSKLKNARIKIGICTSDNRNVTEETCNFLNISNFIDEMICGDDLVNVPKPRPENALRMCKILKVLPSETIVVGDTSADIEMGKTAQVGTTIGVLSGVGHIGNLKGADFLVDNINDILPIIFSQGKYSPNGNKFLSSFI